MLKTLAEESRSIQERKKVHRQVTTYYIRILEEILDNNSISKKDNEQLMNTLWYHEMNIWDCIYRALEIKKHNLSIFTGTKQFKHEDSPGQSQKSKANDSKTKVEEESAPLEEEDYEMLLKIYEETEHQQNQENEDNIINNLIDTFKEQIMPLVNEKVNDANLLKLISSNSRTPNHIKMIGRKSQKAKSEMPKEDPLESIKRNIDKNLKKTVNSKVVDLIENSQELNSINKPKESIYLRVAHKIFEAQEEHKLYFGDTMTTVSIKGKQMKQVNNDAKILILYITNLLLFSK